MTRTDARAPRSTAPHPTPRDNSFDGLRLIGALAVIFGHAYLLTGRSPSPYVLGYPIETVGVVIFFSISGYLITASWQRNRSWSAFFAARCLRIFPALVVVVVVTVFVIGPLVTELSVGEYVRRRDAWTYLGNALLRFQQPLPGVWEGLPDRGVNGPLWTLPVEFVCYLAVPSVLLIRRRWLPSAVFLLGAGAVFVTFNSDLAAIRVWNTYLGGVATMGLFFLAGALLRGWHQGGHTFRPTVAICLVAIHLLMVQLVPGFQWHFGWITLPYVVLTIGLASIPFLRSAARRGDFSYGLYLWGWLVQQIVVDVFGLRSPSVNLLLVLVGSGVLAIASWRMVEAPALRLKTRAGNRPLVSRGVTGKQ